MTSSLLIAVYELQNMLIIRGGRVFRHFCFIFIASNISHIFALSSFLFLL